MTPPTIEIMGFDVTLSADSQTPVVVVVNGCEPVVLLPGQTLRPTTSVMTLAEAIHSSTEPEPEK